MITSPIKTVLTNKSNKRFTFRLGLDTSVMLLPAGAQYSTVTISGDVFSQFMGSRESDELVQGIINGDVVVSYVVENGYDVVYADDVLQASTANLNARYKAARTKVEKAPEVKVEKSEEVADNVEAAKEAIEASVVEVPEPEPETKPEPEPVAAPEVESKNDVEETPAKVDTVEPVQAAEEVEETEAPKKKSRRVKVS